MVDTNKQKMVLQDVAARLEVAEGYLNWTAEVFRAMKKVECPKELKRFAEIGSHLSNVANAEAESARMELERIGAS